MAAKRTRLLAEYLPEKDKPRYNELSQRQGILATLLRAQRTESIRREYEKVSCEKRALVDKYLPEKAKEEYDGLLAKQVYWEDYLDEYDDRYIEKDARFERNRCPIAMSLDKDGKFNFSYSWNSNQHNI